MFLQKRILPSAWGTVMASLRTEFTQKTVPVSAFSGRPPSAGGLKRGSRQVPVQVGGSAGSITIPFARRSRRTALGPPK